jgi:hypothetical protein
MVESRVTNNTRESLSMLAGLDPVLGTCHRVNFQMTGGRRKPKTFATVYVPVILRVPWLTICSRRP